MKKISLILLYFLSSKSSIADTKLTELDEQIEKSEIYTPEEKRMLKSYLAKGVEAQKNFVPPALSKVSTTALVERVLSASMGRGLDYPFLIEELRRRPKELEKIIRDKIEIPIPENKLGFYIGEIRTLPELSILVSQKFQIEMAKKSLGRRGLPKDLGQRFRSHDYLFNILRKSSNDETLILDTLIKEGIIIKGSKFDKKWRPLLKKSPKTINNKNTDPEDKQQPIKEGSIRDERGDGVNQQETTPNPVTENTKTFNHPELETKNTKKIDGESRFPWIVGGLLVLSIAGFFFMKGKK